MPILKNSVISEAEQEKIITVAAKQIKVESMKFLINLVLLSILSFEIDESRIFKKFTKLSVLIFMYHKNPNMFIVNEMRMIFVDCEFMPEKRPAIKANVDMYTSNNSDQLHFDLKIPQPEKTSDVVLKNRKKKNPDDMIINMLI